MPLWHSVISGAPEGPLLWLLGPVHRSCSPRGRLPGGGHVTKGSVEVHLRFGKCYSCHAGYRVDFFFNHGSYYFIRIKCDTI